MKKVLLFLKEIRISEQFEIQAFKAAIAFTLLLLAVLSLGAWWSHRSHRLSPAEVVEPIPTMVVSKAPTHYPAVQPDSGVNEQADSNPTAIPTATAAVSATETLQSADVASEYPELVARVDAAAQSASFTPLQVARNGSEDGYLFHWESQFTPPNLVGIPGGEIYAPYKQPSQYIQVFKLQALDENAERPVIVRIFHPDGQVEVKDRDLPAGKYEWTVWGWLRTRLYGVETAAMPAQPFAVTEQ